MKSTIYALFSILTLVYCVTLSAQVQRDSCRNREVNLLTDSIWALDEIQVTAWRNKKLITGTDKLELHTEALKNLPHFFGATDLIRTMQLMPGVQTAGELNSGIYVRGGEPSHNQVLLNGAPIYNAMHLLGFFSIFNSGHFSSSTLSKSNLAPEFGGRLGAVLTVKSRDSIVHKTALEGNVGMLASQATLSLPLTGKSSLYISGRGTYIGLILDAINHSTDEMKLDYGFQDYNLTYVWQPTSRSKIVMNGYYGVDNFWMKENLYQVNGGLRWINIASSIQWTQSFDNGSKMEQTAFFSSYKNTVKVHQNAVKIGFPSEIKDLGYKGHYNFLFLGGEWQVGADYIFHLTDPQYPVITELFGMNSSTALQRYKTHELGVFINYHRLLTERLSASFGIRYSGLLHTGGYEDKKYDVLGKEVQTITYRKGQLVKYYGGPEPRFSIDYQVSANRKMIFSYGLARQYMSQVTVSGIGFPTDFWVPASKNICPQLGHTLSAGYYSSFLDNAYEISAEGYYHRLDNQLEFDGEMLDMVNQRYLMEDRLLYGKGQAYGVEILLKKNQGRITGWVGYTLGWSNRKFPEINDGNTFSAKHDRRHDFSVAATYRINKKWDCSAVFVYASGNAFTMPVALYLIGENAINEYGSHNGARMPAYHRMDFSVNYWFKKETSKESGLNFSIYNVYARKNPIFLGLKVDSDKEYKRVRIRKSGRSLYSLLPSIGYTFKF